MRRKVRRRYRQRKNFILYAGKPESGQHHAPTFDIAEYKNCCKTAKQKRLPEGIGNETTTKRTTAPLPRGLTMLRCLGPTKGHRQRYPQVDNRRKLNRQPLHCCAKKPTNDGTCRNQSQTTFECS